MIDNNESKYSFDKVCDTGHLPVNSIPVTIEAKQNELHLKGYYETEHEPPTAPICFNFRCFLQKQ